MAPIDDSILRLLRAFKSVKYPKLCHASCEDLSFVPAMTELREITFYHCDLPKDFDQFASLAQLTKLNVYTGDSFNVVDLIRRLINLEKLTFSQRSWTVDEKTFYEIVNVVKGRPNVLTLECEFYFAYNCDKNRKVKLKFNSIGDRCRRSR